MCKALVSILINNYNYGCYVADAIESALNQTYKNVEVIVVDDGSTDNSKEVLKLYESRVKLLFKKNGGQASAFNKGFELSTGEIICFLDADDVFHTNKIEEIVKTFTDNKDIDYVFDKVVRVDEMLHVIKHEERTEQFIHTNLINEMRCGSLKNHLPFNIPATSGLSFSRALLNRIFPIPESESCSMCENYMKYIAVGVAKGVFYDSCKTLQRIHGKNLFTNQKRDISMDARISLLTGYWLSKNFPELNKFANTQIALGLSFWIKAKKVNKKYRLLIKEYLSDLSFLEKAQLILRSVYYFFSIKSKSLF